MAMNGSLLHVGCGGEILPGWLGDMGEVRLDIDAGCEPDILAPMTDMGEIGPFDMIYCCHALEHLYPHQVPVALREFARVLRDGGTAVVIVPNLEGVKPSEDVLYESPAGPICGLDMYYGKASLIEESPYMAHHCGFVAQTLADALRGAGFKKVAARRLADFNLLALGVK